MPFPFNENEEVFVKRLAELYEGGKLSIVAQEENQLLWGGQEVQPNERESMLAKMEGLGVICDAQHVGGGPYYRFNIDVKAIEYARDFAKREQEDYVDKIKNTIRRKPILAGAILFISGLTLLAACVTQVAGALKVLGIIK